MADNETEFRSLDGTLLVGSFEVAPFPTGVAVLVHGSGVTREEGGFFTRLAPSLANAGISTLRFDLRAHGGSGGREEELTIASVVNDIRAAVDHACDTLGWDGPVHVISASFSGGASAMYAGRCPANVGKLVLLNPRLDYRERFTTSRPGWFADYLGPDGVRDLDRLGYTERSPFALGRALLNEVLLWDLPAVLSAVQAPALVVHGTRDTFVDVALSRKFAPLLGGGHRMIEIEGAQHGFAVHDDPGYAELQTQEWQRQVIDNVTGFLAS